MISEVQKSLLFLFSLANLICTKGKLKYAPFDVTLRKTKAIVAFLGFLRQQCWLKLDQIILLTYD